MTTETMTRRGPYYTLLLLILVYACHFFDRSIVAVVQESVKHEFGLSDSALGAMAGFAYAMSYAAFGIPLGLVIDRVKSRIHLLAGLLAVWSFATAICAAASSATQLVIARVFVGAAEAGGSPVSMAIISDMFPPQRRSTAIGLFFTGMALGSLASYGVGAYVVAHYGWRAAFLLAGIPGLILAVFLIGLVKDPGRTKVNDAHKATPLPEAMRAVFGRPGLRNLIAAVVLTAMMQSGFVIWIVSFYVRVHEVPITTVGIVVAIAMGVMGGISSGFGGWIVDRVAGTDRNKIANLVSSITLATVPMGLLIVLVPSATLSLSLMVVYPLLLSFYLGPGHAAILSLAPVQGRGVVIGTLQVMSNLVGYGVGPYLVGALSDAFGLRYALAVIVMIQALVAVLFFKGIRQAPEGV